jgi:hypothetical protein
VYGGESGWWLRKKNGKKAKRKNGKRKNGKYLRGRHIFSFSFMK